LVYAVAPGFVATDMAQEILASEEGVGIRAQSPLNRVARPDEIAETVGRPTLRIWLENGSCVRQEAETDE
jgi:NAD(P)-dependent dehydrogenase (short-subunit alcohol dehydrogenase family)